MLIFKKGLKIAFWDNSKLHLIEGKIRFKTSQIKDSYMVDAFRCGSSIIHENRIEQVLLKDMYNNDIWVDMCDLYSSYPNGAVIGPDTTYKCHITGSRNSGRYPWSGSVNKYIRHDEIVVKAAIREWGITPKKVIFNGPATIVIWQDGTKTVVKKTDGDTDDREKAVMYAILKKEFGSRANMNRYLKQFFKEECDE